jgi:hypothetical protein
MATTGSGERALILSDLVSVDGSTQDTPPSGRILIFFDTTQNLWSKDEFGVVMPLNGGISTEISWQAFTGDPLPPSPTGEITHQGRAAVGLAPGTPMVAAGIKFQVAGSEAVTASVFLKEGAATTEVAGYNQVFSSSADGGLFSKPEGFPERRIDAPGLIRKALPAGEQVYAPDGFQYIVFGSLTLGAGAVLHLSGDADLVIL